MDERVVKFRVGVMVISTMFLAGILVLLFGDFRSLARGYTIYMHFTDAPGVTDGTPVRKSGILIGRVTKVSFAEHGGVIVEAEIYRNVKLYRSEIPQVTGSLLGGDVVIQFVRRANLPASERPSESPGPSPQKGGPPVAAVPTHLTSELAQADPAKKGAAPPAANPNEEIREGDYIEGAVAPNAFQVIGNLEGDLSNALGSLSTAGNEVGKLAGSLNKLMTDNDEQLNRIVNKTETTLDTLERTLGYVDDVMGDPEVRANVKQMLAELPVLLKDSREAVSTVNTALESMNRNLTNLEGFTGPLGERGEDIVGRMDSSLARLDDLLTEMSDLGRKLNSGKGTLSKFLSDPQLYDSLTASAKNVECLTRQLAPIVADARVFSDKIARHPELLGVRGALQRNPGTK